MWFWWVEDNADHRPQGFLVFRYGGHIGKRQDPGDEISKGQVGESPLQALLQARGCFALLSNLLLFPNSYKNSHFQNEGKCEISLV